MGIYDRDYVRRQPLARAGFGSPGARSVTMWLIVVNLGVYLLDTLLRGPARRAFDDLPSDVDGVSEESLRRTVLRAMHHFMGPILRWDYFSLDTAVLHGQVWRFISYSFVHFSPFALVGAMLAVFLFGPVVEARLGGRRYLAFYLLCGLAGSVACALLTSVRLLGTDPATPLFGAAAAALGLIVASAVIAPDVPIHLGPVTVTIQVLAFVGIGLAIYFIVAPFTSGDSNLFTAADPAHFAGGLLGFLLVKKPRWLNPFGPPRAPAGGTRRPVRPFRKDWSKDMDR